MDIISHGLWGSAAFGRSSRKLFLWAFFFGIAPDLFSFGIFNLSVILGLSSGLDWSAGPPDPSLVPQYVHSLYNVTHSFVTFAVVFSITLGITRKMYWPLLAWPLHILMDIFTHSTRFFATPFLWPISEYRFDGISWAHPYIFYPNWTLLIVAYLGLAWYWHRKKKN